MRFPGSRWFGPGVKALLLGAALLVPVAGHAQTTISSLPYTITNPGKYVLGYNLPGNAASGAAITVSCGNVDLDLGGYVILGGALSSTGLTPNVGILVNGYAQVRIHDGAVSSFGTGVLVNSGAADVEIDGLNIGACQRGMYLVGQDLNVHGNRVHDITGAPSSATFGIFFTGQSVRVWDNTIRNIRAAAGYGSYGIEAQSSYGDFTYGSIEGNRIYLPAGLTASYGIQSFNNTTLTVLGNQVINGTYGILNSATSMKYGNNVVTGAQVSYSGGTDIGNNH